MRASIAALLLVILGSAAPLAASANAFQVNKLAADQAGVAASTDPDLVGAWGIGASPSSPLWLTANGSGKVVLYNGAGVKQGLVVTIPGTAA